MTLESILTNGRLLVQSHQNLIEIRLRRGVSKMALRILAGLLSVIGLMFLEITAYLALASPWGDVRAAAAIAIGNLAVSALIFMLATRAWFKKELIAAEEMREVALRELKAEARNLAADSGRQILLPLVLGLITMGLRSLRKRTTKPHAGES